MRHLRFTTRTRTRSGFSLVEIMVALVVIAVGLIAIVGLIPQGIQSSRSAGDNTLVATIVHDVFNTMRSQPFTAVNLNAFGFVSTLPAPYDLRNPYVGPLQAPQAYFDSSGLAPANPPADNYYRVVLTFRPHPALPLSLSMVTATVTWPVKSAAVPAIPLNTQVFFTEIANYR